MRLPIIKQMKASFEPKGSKAKKGFCSKGGSVFETNRNLPLVKLSLLILLINLRYILQPLSRIKKRGF